ncbi:MAG: chloride channel protein [Flavobacteriales bacterium]|jgi:H+/Cl- antiporter ClcA
MNIGLKLLVTCIAIAAIAGTSSALFLSVLDLVTSIRVQHIELLLLLPLAGLLITYIYKRWDNEKDGIGPKSFLLILFGTWITHLFGGSAGREGTAVQMGKSVAHQWKYWDAWWKDQGEFLSMLGISAGFAAVFGTPLAGAVYAIEHGRRNKHTPPLQIIAAAFTAVAADLVCSLWGIEHTIYQVNPFTDWSLIAVVFFFLLGVFFMQVAYIYRALLNHFKETLNYFFKNSYVAIFIAAILIVFTVLMLNDTRHIGLGIPYIQSAFHTASPIQDGWIKLLLTALTIAAGFKGGEVTPLFYIGATIGSTASLFFPVDISVLASIGFILVFAAVSQVPIACFLLAIELFGFQGALPVGVALMAVAGLQFEIRNS